LAAEDDEDWAVWWCDDCKGVVAVQEGATVTCRICGGTKVRQMGLDEPLPVVAVATEEVELPPDIPRLGPLDIEETP
jgi:hypothetical protein